MQEFPCNNLQASSLNVEINVLPLWLCSDTKQGPDAETQYEISFLCPKLRTYWGNWEMGLEKDSDLKDSQ